MVLRVEERMEDSEKGRGASRQVFDDFVLEGLFSLAFSGTTRRRATHRGAQDGPQNWQMVHINISKAWIRLCIM